MAVKLKWNGSALLRFSREAAGAGIRAATIELQTISRKKASIPNPATRHKRVKDTSEQGGGPKGSQYSTWDNSSKAGESVRRRTGFGQKNIVWGYDGTRIIGRVGYTRNARYMTFHELGIRYSGGLQKRPTLVPALADNLSRLFSIVKRVAQQHKGPMR